MEHGGQTRVLLSVTHAAVAQVKALVTNVRAGLQHIRATAPQLPSAQRWKALVCIVILRIRSQWAEMAGCSESQVKRVWALRNIEEIHEQK